MRIGIIGSGRIGATVARLLVSAGHEVAIANSRGPGSLTELVAELGEGARAATVAEAAAFGDTVLVAVPLHAIGDLPPAPFTGRVVIDANNYYPARDGHIPELDDGTSTSSELLAAHLTDAEVVKAFNTMYYKTLAAEGSPGAPRQGRLVLFIAGDDADAKRRVGGLIEELGFAAVDTGSLAGGGRRQQAGAPLYGRSMHLPEAERELAALGA
jgi:predicted dinucleotide-binding enzyme